MSAGRGPPPPARCGLCVPGGAGDEQSAARRRGRGLLWAPGFTSGLPASSSGPRLPPRRGARSLPPAGVLPRASAPQGPGPCLSLPPPPPQGPGPCLPPTSCQGLGPCLPPLRIRARVLAFPPPLPSGPGSLPSSPQGPGTFSSPSPPRQGPGPCLPPKAVSPRPPHPRSLFPLPGAAPGPFSPWGQ